MGKGWRAGRSRSPFPSITFLSFWKLSSSIRRHYLSHYALIKTSSLALTNGDKHTNESRSVRRDSREDMISPSIRIDKEKKREKERGLVENCFVQQILWKAQYFRYISFVVFGASKFSTSSVATISILSSNFEQIDSDFCFLFLAGYIQVVTTDFKIFNLIEFHCQSPDIFFTGRRKNFILFFAKCYRHLWYHRNFLLEWQCLKKKKKNRLLWCKLIATSYK